MPPLPPVAKVLRVHVTGENQGHPWLNGFHVQYAGGTPASVDLNNFCAAFGSQWAINIAQLCLPSTTVTGVTAVDLTSSTAAEGSDSGVHAGTHAGTAPLDTSTALVVSWGVNMRWRGGHFRTYMTGLDQSEITGGNQWDAVFQALAATQWAAFRSAVAAISNPAAPFTLVGVRYKGKDTTVQYPFVIALNAPTVHPRIDNQRRRLGKELT